jgi:hypothetical protein
MPRSTRSHPVSLADVLAYRNPGVVARYAKDHQASMAEAEEVFGETLKWLYLCYRSCTDRPRALGLTMTPELEKIDWMWHAFILFTRDYAAFCHGYFGFFLHHVPEVEQAGDEVRAPDEAAMRSLLGRQFSLVYDVFGEDTLIRWHDQCRYAAESLHSARRPRRPA